MRSPDPIKSTTAEALRALRDDGVRVVMLTGDHRMTARAVAKKLGRRPMGFELSKEYFRQATARLKSARPGDALDGAEDPLTSAPPTNANGRKSPVRRTSPPPAAVHEINCDFHSRSSP